MRRGVVNQRALSAAASLLGLGRFSNTSTLLFVRTSRRAACSRVTTAAAILSCHPLDSRPCAVSLHRHAKLRSIEHSPNQGIFHVICCMTTWIIAFSSIPAYFLKIGSHSPGSVGTLMHFRDRRKSGPAPRYRGIRNQSGRNSKEGKGFGPNTYAPTC